MRLATISYDCRNLNVFIILLKVKKIFLQSLEGNILISQSIKVSNTIFCKLKLKFLNISIKISFLD